MILFTSVIDAYSCSVFTGWHQESGLFAFKKQAWAYIYTDLKKKNEVYYFKKHILMPSRVTFFATINKTNSIKR